MSEKPRFRFRAWHKPTKKLFDVFYFTDEIVFENILDGVGTSPTNPAKLADCVLEQCTGLKDKKGQLIYEGDVVDILCEVEEQGVIEWDKEEAQFVVRAEQAGFVANFSNYRGTDLEVIGNIHENMELVEAENGK